MNETIIHELKLNGVVMAHYTIDNDILFLKIREKPEPLKTVGDNEEILAHAISKIENKEIYRIAYLNIQ